MKQINLVLIGLLVIILIIPIFIGSRIDEKLTYEIEAPIGLVFDEFSDLEHFSQWEKLTKDDTLTQKTFLINEDGEKEKSEWKSSNSSVGNGQIFIDDFLINQSINYNIKFEGWEEKDQIKVDFDQLPNGNTKVDVHYYSQEVPYLYRYFLWFNSPIKKLEESISNFNTLIKIKLDKERKEGKLSYGEFRIVKLPKKVILGVKKVADLSEQDVTKKIDEAFETIYKSFTNEEDALDYDLGFNHVYKTEVDLEKKKQTLFAGIPFSDQLVAKKNLQKINIADGEYLLTLHQGSRSKKAATINSMKNYAKSKNLQLLDKELEVFLNDPKETDTLQLKSQIYIPIKSN